MKQFLTTHLKVFFLILTVVVTSCKDEDEPTPPSGVTASFQFEVDAEEFNKVQFTNFSQKFASLSWDFGDGSAASAEENPVHTYDEEGTYNVTLTATGADGVESEKTLPVIITDPNVELKKLTGETSKIWKLIRDVSTGHYPLQVGPADHSSNWWASGLNEELSVRPCLFNDEYIFSLSGKTFEYKTNGDLWKDGDVWASTGCGDTSDPDTFLNKNGEDITAWGDGMHTFDYNVADQKLSVVGTGAFIGLTKVINGGDGVLVPQASVTYDVIKLVDDVVDTLIVEASFPNNGTPGYWRFVLVHYDNPALEPSIGGGAPVASFTSVVNGTQVSFTNTSTEGTIAWDFGDGATSSTASPTHEYGSEGFYIAKLTITSGGQSSSRSQYFFIAPSTMTSADLDGASSRTWKLAQVAGAFGVGEFKGADNWWPNGANITADRPCLFNDEFIFSTGGEFEYDAQADIFGEPYLGIDPGGCTAEANVTGNAAIWTSGVHTFSFTEATGGDNPAITVGGLGAFIALPKAFNGGEYTAETIPTSDSPVTYEVINFADNGSTQAMHITVNIGGGFWSFILVSE